MKAIYAHLLMLFSVVVSLGTLAFLAFECGRLSAHKTAIVVIYCEDAPAHTSQSNEPLKEKP